jgi:hypothetical protein
MSCRIVFRSVCLAARASALALVFVIAGCVDSTPDVDGEGGEGPLTVTVDLSAPREIVQEHAFGMHASVYDNALHDPAVPALLDEAGVTLLRWPGGGYSDNYHWSTHSLTPSYGDPSQVGYLAAGSDFGSFVALLDSFGGTAMITVNYGSNLGGTGPGEPKEAAAWVAYSNGDPADPAPIGLDSAGNDWQTVGYWAGLRATEKLATDDGRNFLRIARPAPLGIRYWEVGNEVFGNGYYGSLYEEDLHVPFDGTERAGNPALSGSTYGQGVNAFIDTMKAVDPTIKVGAVLNTPPADYSWGKSWNSDVLGQCAQKVDFVIVHWYPSGSGASLLNAPGRDIPAIYREVRDTVRAAGGSRASEIEMVVTELGPKSEQAPHVTGLFAAHSYVTFLEYGFENLDWLELHNGSFLSEPTQAKGPGYQGIRMAHLLVGPGDTLVTATSSNEAVVVAHAAQRADGTVGIMLASLDATTSHDVTVKVGGGGMISSAVRWDYVPTGNPDGGDVVGPTPADGFGDEFMLAMPPHAVTDVILSRTP